MLSQVSFITVAVLLVSNAFATDLSKPATITIGDRLSECIDESILLIDRITIPDSDSYTKSEFHSVTINTDNIFVAYEKKHNMISVLFINNRHNKNNTSIEKAKNILLSVNNSLVQPALKICSTRLNIDSEIDTSMVYMDPPYKSRKAKKIVMMDTSGRFVLP